MGYIGQTPSAVPLDGSDIADDIVDSQHYAAGSIDTAHLADDQITLAKMAAGTDGNLITYDASGNPAAVATGSSGQVLTSAGAGAPPTFSAAPSHTGNVAFPATQVASADVNTLDDYQEGTWTASVTDGTNAASPTVTGSYTKIGDLVYATAFLGLSSLASASGGAYIAGLPFTSKNDGRYSSITVGYTHHYDSMTAGHNILGHLPPFTTLISLYVADLAIGASGMTTAEFSANGQLLFSIMYKAA